MTGQLPGDAITAAASNVGTSAGTSNPSPSFVGSDAIEAAYQCMPEHWKAGLAARDKVARMLEAAAPVIAAEATRTERERADKLGRLASRLLGASMFYDEGHPGRPCHRTGWVEDSRLDAWRKELADLLDGAQ